MHKLLNEEYLIHIIKVSSNASARDAKISSEWCKCSGRSYSNTFIHIYNGVKAKGWAWVYHSNFIQTIVKIIICLLAVLWSNSFFYIF